MLGDKGVVVVCVALFIYSNNIVANIMGRLGKGRRLFLTWPMALFLFGGILS